MRKKILSVSMVMLIFLAIFMDVYLRIEYDHGLFTYFERSPGLTQEERHWLEKHGPIIYGADQSAPPLRYHDKKSGQFKGIVVDYLRALSIELGVEFNFVPYVWEDALDALASGESDICDMYPSDKRSEVYLFTDTIYNQKSIILTRSHEADIQSVRDLNGRLVAVQKGDYASDFIRNQSVDAVIVYTDDYKESIALLLDRRVDAVVGDEPVITYFMDELGVKESCRIVDKPLFELESVLAVNGTDQMLVSILNKGIYNLKRKETMEKIYQKWYGISAPFIKEKYTEKLIFFLIAIGVIVLMFAYLFYSWNRLLVHEVNKRTSELNRSKKNLQTTFNSLKHLMVVIDKENGIVSRNVAYSNTYPKPSESFLNDKSVCDIMDKTFISGKGRQLELSIDHKIFEIETYPLEEEGGLVYRILVMAKDVTRIRLTEREMLQSNKMKAVGHLAAGIAHEIRNPLGTIRNFAYILKNDLTKDSARREQSLDIIVNSVEKAGNIIENLLNFSRISGDDYEMTNMHDFINGILSLEHNLMNKQHIKTSYECDRDLTYSINRESMKHIIINFISNALDAMPDGGNLSLKCTLTLRGLEVVCTDTGIGMDSNQIENIFNPFYTTKQKSGGTGLGLYLIYNEVQKLDGLIEVESKLGQGTTMRVVLPHRKEVGQDEQSRNAENTRR